MDCSEGRNVRIAFSFSTHAASHLTETRTRENVCAARERSCVQMRTYAQTAKYPNKTFDTFTNEPKREARIILKAINNGDK